MKKLILFLAISVGLAHAQFTPPPVAAYDFDGTNWNPLTTTDTGSPLGYTPPAQALYCYNTGTGKWVPATSSCLGGGGGGGVTWPTSGDLVVSNGTSSPAGLAPVNGDCAVGSGGVWTAGSCGGGGSTISLTAATAIAAGSAVSVNSSGQAVQTWGPAPQIPGTAVLLAGAISAAPAPAIAILGADNFLVFNSSGSGNYLPVAAQACSISTGVVSCGALNTDVPSLNTNVTSPSFSSVANVLGLSGSLFVVPYNDPGTGNLTVAAGSIDGSNNIAYGTPVQVIASAGQQTGNSLFSIVKVNTSAFLLGYTDAGNASWVVAGTVSGTTVTLGTPVELTTNGSQVNLVLLGTGSVLVAYNDASNSGNVTIRIATITVLVTTLGTASVISDTNAVYWFMPMSSSMALLIDSGGDLYAIGVSGSTITVGTANSTLASLASTGIPFIQSTSGTTFAAWSTNPDTINRLYNGSVSGTTISLTQVSTPPPFGTIASGLTGNRYMISDTNFAIYEVDTSGNVSAGVDHQFLTGYWLYTLDSTHALATLRDQGALFYARVINYNAPNPSAPIGISAAGASISGTVVVTPKGQQVAVTGCTAGAKEYFNGDGTLTTGNTGWLAGTCTSTTELLVQ